MLEARSVAGSMVVSGINAPRREILPWYIGRDKSAVAVCRHHAMHALLHETHHQVGIVDCHVLVIGIWFAAAQEIGQVDWQKAHSRQACGELVGQEFRHIGLFAMSIGIGWTKLWYRQTH